MKFLSFSVFVVFSFVSSSSFSQTTEKWTLEKCVEYALKNNIQVRQAGVTAQISANENLQSKLNLLPSIDGSFNLSNNYGSGFNPQTFSFAQGTSQSAQTSVQATLPVFTGLQQLHNIHRAQYELLASKFDYENAQQNVALSVASAYLQVLLNKEILIIAEKQMLLTQEQRRAVLARVKTGALPEMASLDIESQLARDEANVVNAQNSVDLGLLSLRQLLQITDGAFDIESPEVEVDVTSDITGLTSLSVYEYALQQQPMIKSAEARVSSANASRKIAIGTLSPTISVFGTLSSGYFSQDKKVTGYSTGVDSSLGFPIPFRSPLYGDKTLNEQLRDNFRTAVGVNVNIPLFSRWQRVTNIQNARLQMQIRELQLDNTKNQLRQDIELAYTNAKAAVQSYSANKRSMEAAQKSFEAMEKRYLAGLLGSYEFQQSKTGFATAESEMIRAKYTYLFRLKVLDFYQGKPLKLQE